MHASGHKRHRVVDEKRGDDGDESEQVDGEHEPERLTLPFIALVKEPEVEYGWGSAK
jgi:hypothetical protein